MHRSYVKEHQKTGSRATKSATRRRKRQQIQEMTRTKEKHKTKVGTAFRDEFELFRKQAKKRTCSHGVCFLQYRTTRKNICPCQRHLPSSISFDTEQTKNRLDLQAILHNKTQRNDRRWRKTKTYIMDNGPKFSREKKKGQ